MVGQANDPLEREADRVANQVMRMAEPAISIRAIPPRVSRKCAACEEEDKERPVLQAKPMMPVKPSGIGVAVGPGMAGPGMVAPRSVQAVLRSPGNPLPEAARSFFEPRFGYDFSHVRVHTDDRAARSAAHVQAAAYASGAHIVFAQNKYDPHSAAGRSLIAHELTHVVQQGGGNDHLVQRSGAEAGAEQDEEGAPTDGGAEESGLSDLACGFLPDSAVVSLIQAYFATRYPLASRHIEHYLSGSGTVFTEDVEALFAANPRALTRVTDLIRTHGGSSGSLVGRTTSTAVIRQRDYDSEDWRLSLGNVDQIDYEIGEVQEDGRTAVTLTLHDPYEWHPDEDRGDQCIHQTMERQKESGASDYVSEGTGVVFIQF